MKAECIEINLIDYLFRDIKKSYTKDFLIVGSSTFFIILLSRISFYLPHTPIPITAQSFAILIIGSSLGMKKALSTSLLYIGIGLIGFPVFSGGKFGVLALTGPTGGYLIGFIIAAALMGHLGDKAKDRKFLTSLPIFLLGHLIIFSFGLLWLTRFAPTDQVLNLGLYPFIPGLILKTLLAGTLTPLIWKWIKYTHSL